MTSRNPFILTASHFGPMIANRLDYHRDEKTGEGFCGVGCDLMEWGEYRREEVDACFRHIEERRRLFGDGVVALDVGANIGTHTIPWAKKMTGWGEVIAIEPQERVFYALAGNISLNNCFNARALWAAAWSESGRVFLPTPPDPRKAENFGGYPIVHGEGVVAILSVAIDDLALPRLDFLKIDVEGMELDVLKGAQQTITRCRPIIVAETRHIYTLDGYLTLPFDEMNTILKPVAMEEAA